MFPTQVLDMQMDFIARMDDYRFRAVAKGSYTLDSGPRGQTLDLRRAQDALADTMVNALHAQAKAAYAFRVTEDMSLVVQGVAAALDETDLFHRELAPTGTGFVRFDRPLPVTDVRGQTMKVHYLWWGPVTQDGRPATMLTWFNDSHDPDEISDDMPSEILASLGRWRWIGADVVANGQHVGSETWEPTAEQAAMIEAEGDVPGAGSNAVRYAHALWTLLGQSITLVEDDTLDRAARRRAGKAGIPPRVSVVQLRRSAATARADGESLVEWKRRWIQRAHMRWQPYGTKEVDHEHVFGAPHPDGWGHMERMCVMPECHNVLRRIAIPAAVKGPADAPLVVPEKVYSLER